MAARALFEPPRGLDDRARALWRASRDECIAQGTWRPTDVALLERYVRADARARKMRANVERDGSTVEGSQGQPVQNPDLKTLREAELDAHRYATDLILTPESRRRHGIEAPKPAGGRLESIIGGRTNEAA